MAVPDIPFDAAPYRLSGTVYGTLLNARAALDALGEAATQPPYKAAPKAPVLYVKPRNTLAGPGDAIGVPADAPRLQTGPALGLVIGRTACRVAEADVLAVVAGYTIVNDLSVPHDSFYRPSIRFKARDGFCPIGPCVVARQAITDPDALAIRVEVDGQLVLQSSTAGMIRSAARLLADVTEFMTLSPGDILMLGVPAGAPLVEAGQRVAVEIAGIGRLENTFIAEQAEAAA